MMNKQIIDACVYWDGGYISTLDAGLKGKHLTVQKRLIKAISNGLDSVVTTAGDELPIKYKDKKPKSTAERQASLKKKRADAGLVRVEIYATKENAAKIKDYAKTIAYQTPVC